MAAGEDTRYSDNDTGPFAATTHELHGSGPGPREVDLDMRDTDVVLNVFVDRGTVRLLHLQNVRDDTAAAARAAADAFLGDLKAADDDRHRRGGVPHPDRSGHTMLESFTGAHSDLRGYVEAQAGKLGLSLRWSGGGFPRESFRRACSQPKYLVRFCDDGSVDRITGSRGVPYPKPRGPRPGEGNGDSEEA